MTAPSRRIRPALYPSALLWTFFLLALAFFQLQRLVLLLRFWGDFRSATPLGYLARAFVKGLTLDQVMAGYLAAPCLLALLAMVASGASAQALSRWLKRLMLAELAVAAAAGWGELEFYGYFHDRYNAMAADYADTPGIVWQMIWQRYHPLLVLAAAGATCWAAALVLRRADEHLRPQSAPLPKGAALGWLAASLAAVVLFIRGGIGLIPAHLGSAYFSTYPSANKLAVNGLFSLVTDVEYQFDDDQSSAKAFMYYPESQALARARSLLLDPNENWLDGGETPLVKSMRPVPPSLLKVARPNIVLIVEESLAAQEVGAVGGPIGSTPEFDRLAKDGVLFSRYYSQGERTGRALFSLVTGLPSPPGKQVTKTSASRRGYVTLAEALVRQGYRCRFVYGGDLEFDNMNGFMREHGFQDVLGVGDFPDGRVWQWRTKWGVPDHLVLDRVNELLSRDEGPTFTLVMTLSNHPPFTLPAEARRPYKGALADERNAAAYADWALGRFVERARKSAYFDRTLFVVVGDHGQYFDGVPSSELSLLHVPCLFYGPKVLALAPKVIAAPAGHSDLGPTLVGLLGGPSVYGFWGRDLFHYPKLSSRLLAAIGGTVFWIKDREVLRDQLFGQAAVYPFASPDRLEPGRPLKPNAFDADLIEERTLTQVLRMLTSPAPKPGGPQT